jgi:two-component system sensor histidine kinase TctE
MAMLLITAAVLAVLLYVSVRTVAGSAVEATQDSILGAATIAIAEELRGGEEGVEVDIPYSAFSMLGAVGQDRVFYRILIGGDTITGYPELPLPEAALNGLAPVFYSATYQDERVRLAAVERAVLAEGRSVSVTVLVGTTRLAEAGIVAGIANRAAAFGLGFLFIAGVLAVVTTGNVLRPLSELAAAVGRRGPRDLRPVTRPVPSELRPVVAALNGFMGRLSGALSRTETFIAEAAHHIRTPLAIVRSEAEMALRDAPDDAARARMRGIIRAVDGSARSASQLLDHAMVIYRTDQRSEEDFDIGRVAGDVVQSLRPAADIKEIDLGLSLPEAKVALRGDRLLLESALRNMIENAIKYSPDATTVEVSVAVDGGQARITVADRGRGLGEEAPDTLIPRFRRGANVGDVVGSGLGLTIVSEVAQGWGGVFRLSNREGGGACAELILPVA